jgi:hypothetical protein
MLRKLLKPAYSLRTFCAVSLRVSRMMLVLLMSSSSAVSPFSLPVAEMASSAGSIFSW